MRFCECLAMVSKGSEEVKIALGCLEEIFLVLEDSNRYQPP